MIGLEKKAIEIIIKDYDKIKTRLGNNAIEIKIKDYGNTMTELD